MENIALNSIPDPFSPSELAKLRLSQNFSELTPVKQMMTSVPCRKPHKQEFVRTRPGEENRFTTGTYTDKEARETYLVSPEFYDQLMGQLVPTMLVVCLTRNSPIPFLWPLAIPSPDRPLLWHQSAITAAQYAEESWIKVVADNSASCYVTYVAQGNLPDPDWSSVPPMEELLKLSFKDRFIRSADHPVLKRFRGEI